MKRAPAAVRGTLLFVVLVVLAGAAVVLSAPLWAVDQAVRLNLWRSGVRSEYVTVDGARIHYLEAKPRAGSLERPLVLVHGLGAKAEDWAPLVPALAAHGFHVYALDLLGYGRSARPADASFSIAEEEAVTTDFMNTLGIDRADVGGWSMGGWVAMRLALNHPKMVDHLLLYDSAGIYFSLDSPGRLFAPQTPDQFRELVARLTPRTMPGFLVADGLRRFQRNSWVIGRSVAAMTSGADLLDFRLGRLHRPTLIVWGAEDRLIPLAVGEALHRGIAGSTLTVIPGCGHLTPVQCARPTLAATLNFLEQRPVERAAGQGHAVTQP